MTPHKINWKTLSASAVAVGALVVAYSDIVIEAISKAAQDAEKGITLGTIGAVVYAINRQRRRKAFEKRDARWEQKIDAIGAAVKWSTPPNGWSDTEAMNAKPSYSYLQVAIQWANQLGRRWKMKEINRNMILPVISFIALMIKQFTGYEIPEESFDLVATIILSVIALVGLFVHPTKPKETVVTVKQGVNEDGDKEYSVSDQPTK